MHTATTLNRYHGALLGLACGDALGTTLEFRDRGTFTPIADMIGDGPFDLEAGEWTDDTSMAMCLAESLIERGFDPLDQMRRYVRWSKDGYWSSNGRCFDIGGTVAVALHRFQATGDPMAGITDTRNAPNGSLMRLAPVPLRYAAKPAEAVRLAAESSKTTHGAREAVDACRYFAALLVGALEGRDKRKLLSPAYAPEGVDWSAEPLAPAIAAVAAGGFKTKSEARSAPPGTVVHTLEAALWAFFRSSDFREGALLAVNLGEDADTTGAVYGQLAGAYYGVDAIPTEWRERIVRRDEILRFATRLFELAWSDRATGKSTQTAATRHVPRDVASRLGHETLGILRTGRYRAPSGRQVDVLAALCASRDSTTEYPPDLVLPAPASSGTTTRITVVNGTVLVAARRMAADGPVAALNFVSPMVPGGGFLVGARAQEESIARSSGLVYTLEGRAMYDFHHERSDALYSDYAIYSPDVPVFRLDDGELLDEPWPLSVVTCAAANGAMLRSEAPERLREIPAVMARRTARVLTVAALHGGKRFILGAWGCGAFGLDPEMMAAVFRDALQGPFRGVFDEIVFAITDWSEERRFIGPFERAFARDRLGA